MCSRFPPGKTALVFRRCQVKMADEEYRTSPADPNTGYNVLVDGESAVFGGTSAVAPLWAALVAIINQQVGKPVGFLNPLILRSGR